MVKPGERYRHYKGGAVQVVAIAHMQSSGNAGDLLKYDGSPLSLAIATDVFYPREALVIYTEFGQSQQWARPLRIFEEVLGNTTKYYRFEKIS